MTFLLQDSTANAGQWHFLKPTRISNTLFYLKDCLYWRYVQYSNHTFVSHSEILHCISWKTFNATSYGFIYSSFQFYIIHLNTVFYVLIDLFKKVKIFYIRYITKAFYSNFSMQSVPYCNCKYNRLPEDEPSGSKHVADIKKLKIKILI